MKIVPKAECLKRFVGRKIWDIGYNDLTEHITFVFKKGKKLEGFRIPIPKFVELCDCKILK